MGGRSLFVLLFFCYAWTSCAERILVLSPLGPRSHINSFMPLVEELAKRGHQITVVTAHVPKTDSPKIRKISLTDLIDLVESEWYDLKQHNLFVNAVGDFQAFRWATVAAYDRFMAVDEIQEIKQNKNYDMIIMDGICNELVLPLIDHIGVPFMIIDPGFGAPWNLAIKDISPNYAFVPPFFGNYGSDMSFFERLNNMVVVELMLMARRYYQLPLFDELAKKDFPNARPMAEIERDAELVLVNAHPTTSWLQALPPAVIPIGASHTRPAIPLPKDLQSFADGAEDGLIIFTLGSNSKVSDMPSHIQPIFFRVFSRLPQRIVCKWESKSDVTIPPNIKLVDWLPQQDLLGHNRTRLFIAHGGLLGNQEALYHAVPVLGLPLGRDQRILLNKAYEEGYALKLVWEDITEELLYESIQRILSQPSFKGNATRMSRIMRDEMIPAREVAAYWVEHVLRHGGARHLQSKSREMPFYKLHLLDVWLFLIACVGLLFFVIYKLCVRVLRGTVTVKVKTQ